MKKTFNDFFGRSLEFREKEDLVIACKAICLAEKLSGAEIDTLRQCFKAGVMDSGGTPSKSGRDSLIAKGVICQVSSEKVEYGFSVTYPLGFDVLSMLNILSDKP